MQEIRKWPVFMDQMHNFIGSYIHAAHTYMYIIESFIIVHAYNRGDMRTNVVLLYTQFNSHQNKNDSECVTTTDEPL